MEERPGGARLRRRVRRDLRRRTLYAGVAGGDIDVYPSAWSEQSQADYMAKYGDQFEDLGAWYDGAVLTLAVPSYCDIDSLADLADHASMFDGRIVGIEPGAGLARTTKESVMPPTALTDEQYAEPENMVVNEYGDGKYATRPSPPGSTSTPTSSGR